MNKIEQLYNHIHQIALDYDPKYYGLPLDLGENHSATKAKREILDLLREKIEEVYETGKLRGWYEVEGETEYGIPPSIEEYLNSL